MAARRNWKCPTLLLITLILWLNAAHCQQTGGNNSRKRDTCPKVVLKNGKIKLRSGGRVVKYSCNRDYVLVGESTSTCLQGEWTSEAPVCATKGCPYIPSPPSGRFIASNGGAVMRLECNPGYRPSGSPMIYCVDKFDWNGTAPLCQASGVQQSATRCDFESDDLCGWVQDTRTDEFDWTWQNYGTPSFHLGTGPSFDHTLGQGKAGHYLFIESSSPRVLNDTARLFSPVYGQPEASAVADEGVCFSFWFHMYGSTTGLINVYIKPESKKMSELRPAFVRSGDQGDRWRQGYISLDTVTENFQVVIEGVRGTGYVGDSAIDDVQLTKGEECLAALKRMMADTIVPGGSTAPPSSTIPPNASCSTRCSTSERTEETANTNTSSSSWTCGCSDDCLLKNSCCSDYAAFCLTDGLQGDDDQSGLAADQPSPSASSQTSSPNWLIGTVVAAAVGAALLLTVGVVVIVIRSRNSVSDRRRRPKLRSNQQDQLAEDSDVRYLRDEDDVQLDLTEATPSSKSTGPHRQFADFERL
ncbi:MAM and LDL-receptor class A domain-containing protein 1-like isoform X3 [Daphnia pulex]|uniref:MAM and LDL-receptor class A domain-containing protein 1-like isoform X3 n=1 Tax=Daphnia pulex TaxID=6669 RepID=UPI001EE13F53|nr:MAM and LDL-receptor class A domain-containing protein 1-like isoform X3 [Daphnia pulex]XP_046457298.1 MAM and LDL-receptor class A domain-containing protein 1-like isoform X3 [Daphnia pulex]